MRPALQVGLRMGRLCRVFRFLVIVRVFRPPSWLKLPQDEGLQREHEANIGLHEKSSAEPTKSAWPSAYSMATMMLQVKQSCRMTAVKDGHKSRLRTQRQNQTLPEDIIKDGLLVHHLHLGTDPNSIKGNDIFIVAVLFLFFLWGVGGGEVGDELQKIGFDGVFF